MTVQVITDMNKMCEPWAMLWPSEWTSEQEARNVPQVLFSSLVSLSKLEWPVISVFLADLNDISAEERLHRITSCFPVTSVYLKLPQPLRKWSALEKNYWARLYVSWWSLPTAHSIAEYVDFTQQQHGYKQMHFTDFAVTTEGDGYTHTLILQVKIL